MNHTLSLNSILRGSASGIVYGLVLIGGVTVPSGGNASLTVATSFGETSGGNPVGPCVVWFDVTGYTDFDTAAPTGDEGYDARKDKIHVWWDFGDDGAVPFTGINLPTIWEDTNKGAGHNVCHHYTPGTYTWSYLAYEEGTGKWGSGGGSITVADADAVYTGNRTICFSPDSNFTDAPSGASEVSTTGALDTAIAARVTAGETWRVLLRRGEEYTFFTPTVTSSSLNARFDAYGTGDRPKLVWGDGILDADGWDFGDINHQYIGNIEQDAGYDATTDTGRVGIAQLLTGSAEHCDFFNIKAKGLMNAHATKSRAGELRHAFVNCEMRDWAARGGFMDGDDTVSGEVFTAYVGTAIANPRDSVTGLMERDVGVDVTVLNGFTAGGGGAYPFRHTTAKTVIMQQCYVNMIYANQSLPIDRTDSGWGQQKCLRCNTKGIDGAYYNLYQTALEGGQHLINTVPESAASTYEPIMTGMNLVCDSMLFVLSPGTQNCVYGSHRGWTVRNSIGYRGDLHSGGQSPARFVNAEESAIYSATFTTENENAPVNVYNNTYITRGTRVSVGFKPSDVTTTTDENNIVDTTGSVTGLADDTSVLSGFIPAGAGARIGNPIVTKAQGTDVLDSGTMTFPYPSGTDQAYWQALPASDDEHAIQIQDSTGNGADTVYYSKAVTGGASQFSVSFNASEITVTNNSGDTWPADTMFLKLDRSSTITTDSSNGYGLPASTITAQRPTSGNFEISTGLESFRDFENTTRGATKNQGALEAV